MQTRFDAVVLAGYNPDKIDPLTELTGQPHKALVKVDGRPMVWHVVHALDSSQYVDRIVVIGMGPEDGVDFGREVHYVPDQGSMLNNGVESFHVLASWQDIDRHAIAVSADMPLLTGDMVDWFVEACAPLDKDLYWGIVEKSVMEATFPNSHRSYLRLVEGSYCSGDLFLGKIRYALEKNELIRDLAENRKNVLKQLRLLGWASLLRFLFRRLRIVDLLAVGRRALHMDGAAIFLPFAEVGMDVDKPNQLEQVEAYLRAHPRTYPNDGTSKTAANA